jgi:tetratricopeptide (TPR) repeat protein
MAGQMTSPTNITPDALARAAQLHEQQGRLADAIAAYHELLTRWPDRPGSWYNLGVLLRKARQFPAALACYQQALARGVMQPEEVYLNRGVIYSDFLHQYDAAEHELNCSLTANPTYVPALFNLANLHEDLGRRAAAVATYEKILQIEPRNAQVLARFAGVKTITGPADPVIGRLEEELANPGASAADQASLAFALGRALDSCGVYEAAFDAYERANRFSRASVPPQISRYDRRTEETFIDRIITAFPAPAPAATAPGAVTASAAAAAASAPAMAAGPQPIFICGMFRSGSTLIEQLLASDPQVTMGGELDILPRLVAGQLAGFPESLAATSPGQLAQLAADYRNSLAQLFPRATRVTDKRPDNFLYIGLIKRLFPTARIVHTTRDALDNCLSIYFLHLDPAIGYALDLMDIGHRYLQYTRLMQHWKNLYGDDIIDVSYDAYVRSPDAESGRLFALLGLEWRGQTHLEGASAQAVKTASVWQVREPVYQRSSGRSQHYARQLDPLRAYLETGRLR